MSQPPAVTASLALIALVAVVAASGCSHSETGEMSPDELYALIQSNKAPLILDVRSLGEYRRGHVPGAIHRPFHRLLGGEPAIPAAPDAALVLYCAHGPRAGIAGWGLRRSGFSNVSYLQGHMAAWKKRGLPVESGSDIDGRAP